MHVTQSIIGMLLLVVAWQGGWPTAVLADAPKLLSLQLDPITGQYNISLSGVPLFTSAPYRLSLAGRNYSSADGSLKLEGHTKQQGTDALGSFFEQSLVWRADTVSWQTSFKIYGIDGTGAVVFEQVFLTEAANVSLGDQNKLVSAFPAFICLETKNIGFYQFAGSGVPAANPNFGSWPAKMLFGDWETSSGALALFDAAMTNVVVLSPFSSFMTQNQHYEAGELSFGLQGRVEYVPAQYSLASIMQPGTGFSATMEKWGASLLARAGKPAGLWKSDYSLQMLGYTTDNGAYYYYNTEPGKTYEQTMLALKAYSIDHQIPFRWILYDSWWYLKGNETATRQDAVNGVINWTDADPSVFPSGLRYMYQQTGWSVVAHNRAWDKANVYAKQNGGQYNFLLTPDLTGEIIGLPLEQVFWDDLLQHVREWGCINYQQDWMYTQQDMLGMMTSATLGRQWIMQMDAALVAQENFHFGFGGTRARNWLQGTEMLSVTNGRVSDDYHANLTQNWNIGVASIFCWALQTIPAKDGFWTVAVQPGHPYHDDRSEPYSRLHGAVATLSRGPVSPADKIGLMDRDLIMRSCMADGTLLQPDRPALALDSEIRQMVFGHGGPQGEVWSTVTELGGLWYHHIIAVQLAAPYTMEAAELSPWSNLGPYAVFDNAANVSTVVPFSTAHPLVIPACGKSDFHLYHAIPLLSNNWYLLGEVGKWVPVSSARIRAISVSTNDVQLTLAGVPAETIEMVFQNPAGSLQTVSCTFPQLGQLQMSAASGSCSES